MVRCSRIEGRHSVGRWLVLFLTLVSLNVEGESELKWNQTYEHRYLSSHSFVLL
jgi:hypothetical protein